MEYREILRCAQDDDRGPRVSRATPRPDADPDYARSEQGDEHRSYRHPPPGDNAAEARLLDTTGVSQFGKRYRGTAPALSRMAHMIANDLVRTINGKPGIFLSQIAFASNRSGSYEIWLMDWDGANQRQISRHNALSILPSWSPDNDRMVYTSFTRGTSDMYIINRRGGGRIRLPTGLGLNTSATFSPISSDIAFVGSIAGNPDIYLIRDDGTNIRRITTTTSIESTPEWSPNGRQISFTSGRSGTPQIYVMDAEGTNVQRISFEGEWNDDATWSPDGEQIAYTSRDRRRGLERAADLVTGWQMDRLSVESQRRVADLQDARRRLRPDPAHRRRGEQGSGLVEEGGVTSVDREHELLSCEKESNGQ